jgi:hypothetical protein
MSISIEKQRDKDGSSIRILIVNTGTNLSRVTELNSHSKFTVQEVPSQDGGTSFEIGFRIDHTVPDRDASAFDEVAPMPAFYAEVRKRVCYIFQKRNNWWLRWPIPIRRKLLSSKR